MRLYKIVATSPTPDEFPSETLWVGSLSEGVAARKVLADKGFRRKDINESMIDVPTDKNGLLTFLNELEGNA